jgi:hypothetical protein
VQGRERGRRGDDAKGSNQSIVGRTEASEDEGNILLGANDLASSSQFINYTLHLGEKRICCHLKFLCVRQLDPQVRDLGLTLGGEQLLNRTPDTGGGLNPLQMRQNLWAD